MDTLCVFTTLLWVGRYWLEAVARQRGFASASGADGGSRLGRKVGFVDQQFPEISSAEALGDVDALLTLLGQ